MTDRELIDGCLKGQQSHFSLLYDEYASGLYSICLRYAGADDAKDLLQEGMVKIFRNLADYDVSKGSLKNWMKRIIINGCIDNFRKKKIILSSTPIEQVANIPVDEDAEMLTTINDMSYEDLLQEISRLPAGYRTVFNMYVIDGKNHKEIAATLEISENTSKTQLFKARNLLQKNIYSMLCGQQNK